jgi:hypothetical protein
VAYEQVHQLQELLSYEGGTQASSDRLTPDNAVRNESKPFRGMPAHLSGRQDNEHTSHLVYMMNGQA